MRRILALGAALGLLIGTQVWAVEARIEARSLSHQEIHGFELPEGTQASNGLYTVGVGSAVYLEVQLPAGTEVTGDVTWGLTGPGTAELMDSPLSMDAVPIYTPAEQELYDLVSRQLLKPDAKGQWMVTADVPTMITTEDETTGESTTADGVISLEVTVTAAEFVGAGGIEGAALTAGQCAMCHGDIVEKWAETEHSTALIDKINGLQSAHFNEGCIECHSVGYDTAEGAVNGGFDDVQAAVGWEFPVTVDENGDEHPDLKPGNWEAMPAELQAVSSIQCENCHGPGSEHNGRVTDNRISVDYDAGNCAICHEEEPYHFKNLEWANSLHAATRVDRGSTTCNQCHSGIGFIERVEGNTGDDMNLDHGAINCATCHDPHDATNPHQMRQLDDVTLGNGAVVTEGGYGKLCMQCHKGRRDIRTYIADNLGDPSSHFGPHHGPQTDMLVGENAYEYGQNIRSSSHVYAVENACVTCHMPATSRDAPEHLMAGGHTFWPSWDGGTPDDPSDDVDLVEGCVGCHGPMDSFDIPKDDYDGDGKVEGVQTEVKGLLSMVAKALPPVGSEEIEISPEMTEKDLQALFNYDFVLEDKSYGIHNAQYAVGLLKASIKDLTGRTISTGGQVRVLQGGVARGGLVASAAPAGKMVPGRYELWQNRPNPFNPETEIHYAVPEPVNVRIDIYNSLGQKVRTLVEAHHAVGEYAATWNGRDADGQKVTAGMYIYTIEAGSFTGSGKMVLLP